jgi:hypothetical protein
LLQDGACAPLARTVCFGAFAPVVPLGLRPFPRETARANEIAPSAFCAEGRSKFAEDRDAITAIMRPSSLTFRSQKQRLSFLHRGVAPNPACPRMGAKKAMTLNSLAGTRTGRSDGRSSPPAVKCAVCIGATDRSQADMGIKARCRKHICNNTNAKTSRKTDRSLTPAPCPWPE